MRPQPGVMSFKFAISVEGRTISQEGSPFVVAELGYNFTTLEEALASVDAAADAGADAIKLQTFRADTTATRSIEFPPEAGGGNQHAEFSRFEIDEPTHRAVYERARRCGLVPFSTPSHPDDVELLERVGTSLDKIGSDDLTNLPSVRHVARLGKPMIISSGMATLDEIDEAIHVIHDAGNRELVLLQCVSNYPVTDSKVLNLRTIPALAARFQVLVGYSDHTTGLNGAVAAVALGAVVVERHFTINKGMPVPDAGFSADPTELRALVNAVRDTHAMLGSGEKAPTATERDMRTMTRKSCVARRRIAKGSPIQIEDVIIKRPGTGIPPRDVERVVGRVARRDIEEDEVITWDLV